MEEELEKMWLEVKAQCTELAYEVSSWGEVNLGDFINTRLSASRLLDCDGNDEKCCGTIYT